MQKISILIIVYCSIFLASLFGQETLPMRLYFPDFIALHSSDPVPPKQFYRAMALELNGSSSIVLIDSAQANATLKKMNRTAADVNSMNSAVEMAHRLEAGKILVAEYQTGAGGNYLIRCSLVDVKTELIEQQWINENLTITDYAAFCFKVARQTIACIQKQYVLSNLAKVSHFQSSFQLDCAASKSEFKIGDSFDMTIQSGRNCFVYVYDINSDGRGSLLYPLEQEGGKKLIAREKLIIRNLMAVPPAGAEIIKTIATSDSLAITRLQELLVEQIAASETSRPRRLYRDESPLANDKWTSHELKIFIRE